MYLRKKEIYLNDLEMLKKKTEDKLILNNHSKFQDYFTTF